MTAPNREQLEREAAEFLEEVYGSKPAGTLIAVGPAAKQHFVRTPADAVPYVIGGVDMFVRVSLLGKRPKSGRGMDADAVALPALVADYDVNGSPTGNGGVVTGAFTDRAAAHEAVAAVLEPSLVVSSGYGIQPWWLLEEVEPLTTGEDRARAQRVARGWQERLRQEAGVSKFDSVADLSRLMRPPGSVNSKGAEPVPVRLLEIGGQRYRLEELVERGVRVDDRHPQVADGEEPVLVQAVEELVDRHGDLRRLVARAGTPPAMARRPRSTSSCAVGRPSTATTTTSSLRCSSTRGGRTARAKADSVTRTVAAARARVGRVPRERTVAKAELTAVLRLEQVGRRVAMTRVAGHGAEAWVVIVLDDGYEIEFGRFAHVAMPTKLTAQMATTVGLTAVYTTLEAVRAAALTRRIAERTAEARTSEGVRAVALELLRLAGAIEFDFADQGSRWATWLELSIQTPVETRVSELYGRELLVARDRESGQRFVRCGWAQQYLRLALAASSTPYGVREQLLSIGWRQRGKEGRIKATNPEDGDQMTLTFYVVPVDFELGWEGEE